MEDQFSDSAEVEGLTSKNVASEPSRIKKHGQGSVGFSRAVSVPSQPSPPLQAHHPIDTVLEQNAAVTTAASAAAMRRHSVSFLADAQTVPDQNLDRRRLQRTPTPYYEEPPTDYPTESGLVEGNEDFSRDGCVAGPAPVSTSLEGDKQIDSTDEFVRPSCVKQRHSVTFIDRHSEVDRGEGPPSECMFRPVVEDRQDLDGDTTKNDFIENDDEYGGVGTGEN